jgi:AraC-like DNA-binding protein
MKDNVLLIKNMVCNRCIEAVEGIFEKVGLQAKIELGKAYLLTQINPTEKSNLGQLLEERGFELLEDEKSALIATIKTLIIKRLTNQESNNNISDFLTEHLPYDYAYLSRLFSTVEGITIEKYFTKLRIEKVKELLFYGELSLTEIAHQLEYSSAAYLSTSFKKETGMTPGEFKKLGNPFRKGLDKI